MSLTWTVTDISNAVYFTAVSPGTTFGPLNIGTPAVDRIVVAQFSMQGANAITGLNVGGSGGSGGTSMSLAASFQDTADSASLYWFYLPVPSGTTSNFTLFTGANSIGAVCTIGTINGDVSASVAGSAHKAYQGNPDPMSFTLALPAGGVGLVMGGVVFASGAVTPTWTNASADANLFNGSSSSVVQAHMTAGNPSVTMGQNAYAGTLAGVTFQPSALPPAVDGSGGSSIFRLRRPGWPRYASRRPILPRPPLLLGWRKGILLPNRFQERARTGRAA